jgi:hypothetical protein
MSKKQNLAVVAALCGVFGLAGWAFYFHAFAGERGEDWMVYYNTVRAFYEGKIALIYDGQALTDLLNARLGDYLAKPLPLHPWLYPPHYLLLLLPFGLLPFVVSGLLFVGLGFAGAVAACWRFARSKEQRLVYALSLLLCPASAITFCIGQNTFLTCALLVSGFGFMKQRPVLSGFLLGLLTYKPQLWLMVPVALIACRQWKVLAAAFATAIVMMALSVAVFGLQPWHDWIEIMTAPSALYDQWRIIARLNGQSVYTYATLFGAPVALANTAQAISALFAAACVWWCYRRPMADDLRLAALLAATMLAAPHVIDYDAVLLGIAATLFFLRAMEDGFRFGDTAIAVLIWASPLINPPSVFRIGLVTPFLIVIFLAWVMARGKRDAVQAEPRGILSAV